MPMFLKENGMAFAKNTQLFLHYTVTQHAYPNKSRGEGNGKP